MKLIKLAFMISALEFCVSDSCRGDFQWLGDWQYTPSVAGTTTSGPPSDGAGTGSADVSLFYNAANSSPPASLNSGMTFGRSFRLSGSPGGWEVELMSGISGFDAGIHGLGKSELSVGIVGQPSIDLSFSGGGVSSPFSDSRSRTYFLADGHYSVSGTLTETASLAPLPLRGQFATGEANGNFTVTLTANAVPEPTSIALLACGAIVVGVMAYRRAIRGHDPEPIGRGD